MEQPQRLMSANGGEAMNASYLKSIKQNVDHPILVQRRDRLFTAFHALMHLGVCDGDQRAAAYSLQTEGLTQGWTVEAWL